MVKKAVILSLTMVIIVDSLVYGRSLGVSTVILRIRLLIISILRGWLLTISILRGWLLIVGLVFHLFLLNI
jgi:hypothetical protein